MGIEVVDLDAVPLHDPQGDRVVRCRIPVDPARNVLGDRRGRRKDQRGPGLLQPCDELLKVLFGASRILVG